MFENGQFTPQTFAQAASEAGYSWAALELDDYANALRWDVFKSSCDERGLKPGVWFTQGDNIVDTPPDAAFAIAELEGPGDYDGVMNAILGDRLPDCRLAVATNFNLPLVNAQGVPQPAAAAPLIEAGFECLTECYMSDNPSATPDNLDFTGRTLGWSSTQPIFGTYGGSTVDDYAEWHDWPGWSAYLGEYVL